MRIEESSADAHDPSRSSNTLAHRHVFDCRRGKRHTPPGAVREDARSECGVRALICDESVNPKIKWLPAYGRLLPAVNGKKLQGAVGRQRQYVVCPR